MVKALCIAIVAFLLPVAVDTADPKEVSAITWSCQKDPGTDGNYWTLWTMCNGLEQNDYRQQAVMRICSWWGDGHDCWNKRSPFVYEDGVWAKVRADGSKWRVVGRWIRLCPVSGC